MCWMLVRALHDAGRVPSIGLPARPLHKQQGIGVGIARADKQRSMLPSCAVQAGCNKRIHTSEPCAAVQWGTTTKTLAVVSCCRDVCPT
jgi:hypothetical protein